MLHEPQTMREKVITGSTVVLAFAILGSPLGYGIRLLYSNTLTIEMYGLFYAALAFFSLVSGYLELGLGLSTSYFVPKFMKKKDEKSAAAIFQYCQVIQLFTTAIFSGFLLLFGTWLSAHYFKSAQAKDLISLFSLYLIGNSMFTAFSSLFLGLQREVYYASMQFFRLLFILLFSIILWTLHAQSVLLYASAWAASTFVIVALSAALVLKKYPFMFVPSRPDIKILTSMLHFGIPTLITSSLFTLITSTDSLFLTYFHGLKDVGVYNVVYPLATISGMFLSPINALVLPLTSHLMEGEEAKITHLMYNIFKLVPFVGLYFGLFLALFPGAIVSLLFGTKWSGLVEAPLIIFSLGFVFAPLSTLLVTILSGMGKVKARFQLSLLLSVLNIVFCLLLIPRYGVIGAVVANTIMYISSVVLFTRAIGKFFPVVFPFDFYAKAAFFALGIYVLVHFLSIHPSGWLQVILSGLLYTALFAVFGLTQNVLDPQTVQILSRRLRKAADVISP